MRACYKRFMRTLLRSVTVAGLLALLPVMGHGEPVEVDVTPILLVNGKPDERTVGDLTYRGGLHLVSRDQRFGGFSALGLSADGRRMISISDAAVSFAAELEHDENGNLSGLRNADLNVLADRDGSALRGKY